MTSGQQLILDLNIPGYGSDEVGFMEETILRWTPAFIGDWGTNRGSSARIFYELTKMHGVECEIHTVELPKELECLDRDHPGVQHAVFLAGSSVITHRGDGVTEALIAYERAGEMKPGLFFVDGNHMMENVYREIASIDRFAPTAWLLLHDTKDWPGNAIDLYLNRFPGHYTREVLQSQAGMTRLMPA